eukprot:6181128-Pleurochrysis_carterae.AAC.2
MRSYHAGKRVGRSRADGDKEERERCHRGLGREYRCRQRKEVQVQRAYRPPHKYNKNRSTDYVTSA